MRRHPPIAAGVLRHVSGVRARLFGFIALALLGCADPDLGGRCATERDCPEGASCFAGRCAAPAACALDTDCPALQICLDRRCLAQSCVDDEGCPDRRCVESWCRPRASIACAGDDDCPAGLCDRSVGLCALDICPPTGCAAGCAVDADCPDEAWCAADGVCRAGCRIDGCGAGRCEPETRRCETVGCAVDGDCPAGAFCDAGLCAPGCRVAPDDCPGGRCDRVTRRCGCATDRDCAEDAFCADDGVCRPGCRLDGCASGRCDPVTRSCGEQPCARDGDCPAGEACGLDDPICRPGRGPRPVEAHCAVPDECASGACAAGRCQGRCLADTDCPSGRCALSGSILLCAPPPAPCDRAADCPAGTVCGIWREDGPPRAGCVAPVGEAPEGAPCLDDGVCRSGVCAEGRCWVPCAADADCPGACLPAMVVRVDDRGSPETDDDRLVGFSGCLDPAVGSGAPCIADDCAAPEVCGLWPDGALAGFEPRCRQPGGAGLGGDRCAGDTDCRGRWCAGGVCVAPCAEGAESGCAEGVGCGEAELVVRGAVTATARVCGPSIPEESR